MILTASQAAELLGMHVSTVRQHAAAGRLPGVQIGREWRFVSDAIIAFISGGDKECRSTNRPVAIVGISQFRTADSEYAKAPALPTGIRPYAHGRYSATITVDKKANWLGTFDTVDEAVIARKVAEQKYGFHENHGTVRPL